MKNKIIKFIQNIFEKFGIYIVSINQKPDFESRVLKFLNKNNSHLILDIGANDGGFAGDLIAKGYKGKVVSIEPTIDAYKKIKERAKNFQNWKIEERMAVGESEKIIEINVAKNSVSSSILKTKQEEAQKWKGLEVVKKEKVRMVKLDSLINKYKRDNNKIFLKLDTQGYEMNILKNSDSLNRVEGILLELQVKQYYQTQFHFDDVISLLKKNGFVMVDMEPGFRDKNGAVMEFDALFVRK